MSLSLGRREVLDSFELVLVLFNISFEVLGSFGFFSRNISSKFIVFLSGVVLRI